MPAGRNGSAPTAEEEKAKASRVNGSLTRGLQKKGGDEVAERRAVASDRERNIQKAAVDLNTYGTTGLQVRSGIVFDEYIPELRGRLGRRAFREMSRHDATVGAALFAIRYLCRGVDWSFTPSPDDKTGEVASFFESVIDDMAHPWVSHVTQVLSMLVYGWAYFEQEFKIRRGPDETEKKYRSQYDDGKIGWAKLGIRSQETLYRWEFDDDGDVQGMWQMNFWGSPALGNVATPGPQTLRSVAPVFIPIEKGMLFTTEEDRGNPEGISILRTAYRAFYLKRNIENVEAVGIERDLAGLPMAIVPEDLLSAEPSTAEANLLEEIKKVVTGVRRDEQEGIVWPRRLDPETHTDLFELKLLSSAGQRQINTDGVLNRWDQRILMSVMADWLMLGHEKVGSFALADTKTNLFALATSGVLDQVAQTHNLHGIPTLMRMNGIDPRLQPTLIHSDIEKPNLKELGEALYQLAQAGLAFTPDPAVMKYLADVAGIPFPEEG